MATLKTDKQKIAEAFRNLRRKGFAARMNFLCCQSCGVAEMENLYGPEVNYVFYHVQDTDAGLEKGMLTENGLYLAWNEEPETIIDTLKQSGLHVEWDGSDKTRIQLLPDVRH